MPSYIGVDKSTLLKSLEEGLNLLETHSIGDETQKYIDDIRGINSTQAISPLEKIKNAKTDLELVQAVESSKASYLFLRLYDVMEYHLINDTDGTGKKTVENLAKWGALEGGQTMEYNLLDEEKDSWLLSKYIERIINKTDPVTLKQSFSSILAQMSDKRIRQDFSQGNKLLKTSIKKLKQDKMGKGLASYFKDLSLYERNNLLTVGKIKSGMMLEERTLPVALSRYGIAIDGLSEGKMNWQDPEVRDLANKVNKILEPFFPLAEVDMVGIGLILSNNFKEGAPQGVLFNCSRRVAETIAREMKGYQVMSHEGEIIIPELDQKNVPNPKNSNVRLKIKKL